MKAAGEAVFNFSSKPLKYKVARKPVCNVPSKPVKSKVLYKTAFDVPSKFVNSNVPSRLVKSKFTCKLVSNVPNKHVKLNVPRKSISKVTRKLSNSFASKSTSLISDSPDPSLTCKLVNTTSSKCVTCYCS